MYLPFVLIYLGSQKNKIMFLKVQASDKIILKFLNNVFNAYISTNMYRYPIKCHFCATPN